ncbi:MAG: transcriptional repressor [Candidatus Bipolaricaulota bacterium]|nr:transcriptional repressor [Candidatus Bipolaricaulota bacterium]
MNTLARVWEDQLKQEGYRVTKPRRVVLETLASGAVHLTPEELYRRARRRHRRIGLVTIYRTLTLLERLGMVQRVHVEAGCHSFAAVRLNRGHHHQLVCRTCGRVEEFPDCALDSVLHRLQTRTGFAIEAHHLEVVGRCPECR